MTLLRGNSSVDEKGGWDLPKGTYDAVISQVMVTRRRDTSAWVLRIIVRTVRLDRSAIIWQGLAEDGDDPYAMSDSVERSFGNLIGKLDLMPRPDDPEDAVRAISEMAHNGVVVQIKVAITPVGPQATFFAPSTNGTVSTVEDTEAATNAAFAAHQRLLRGLRAARHGLAQAAEGCHQLQETDGWRDLGHESLSEYLASPEVTLTRSEFYRLAAIWSAYVLEGGVEALQLQAASPSKLEVPLPALGQGLVEPEQALADAESMTRADLRDHYAAMVSDEAPVERPSRRRDSVREWLASEDVAGVVSEGREALGMPQRLPGARQAVRGALERCVVLLEGSDG